MRFMKNIRNFCIIAHIDHGKSTLADRFLELTKTIDKGKMQDQVLDQMDLERERGITIKLQPVRMEYKDHILNLIDTPGHMDFYWEVMRSLGAVEGAILLVDAVKGVQAQTISNLRLAQEKNLKIIPVINKIDLQNARVQEVEQEISELLKIDKKNILKVSAKTGTGVENVLDAIIKHVPLPVHKKTSQNILVFDAFYDSYKGVVAYIRVLNSNLQKQPNQQIGVFKPQMTFVNKLNPGEIGYIATGEKNLEQYLAKMGFTKPLPMVFASLYPMDQANFHTLKDALNKLKLNDASLDSQEETSKALGRGFRCGFLGMLHLEIITERLKREHGLDLVVTTPQVNYKIEKRKNIIREPWVKLEIIVPLKYMGQVMSLLKNLRGAHKASNYLSNEILNIEYEIPLADVICGFYDNLKSASSGYASMSYQPLGMRNGDLVKLEVLLARERVPALSQIVPREFAQARARKLAKKLKDLIPKQNFAVAVQIVLRSVFEDNFNIGLGRVLARENISAMRKDVTSGLYGGDYSRKKKLLEKQKKGKKKMESIGKVRISSDVFVRLLGQS
ncbi:elongation factor 4 [bacterium]|nr:elongation factor 4 [bacterium]